ncbi:hypothetical protein N8Z63_03755 [Octadecabacter sp.]|jgi:hypothetical protein|nr:hypothetical protein [Octadecabacter sp.]
MSFTYDELKTAIQDYTDNTETSFINNLPLFIRVAEERILKNVQLDLFRKNATAIMVKSSEYLGAPTDFLAPFSLSYTVNGDKVFVEFKDVSFCQTYTPNATTEGQPKYYAQFDVSNFLVAPSPDANYDCEMHYFYRPLSLTAGAGSGTTWLSTNAEMCLLYGSLVEANIYLKGEQDIMQMYNSRFTEAMTALKMLGEAKETTQEYRVGRVIRQKQ